LLDTPLVIFFDSLGSLRYELGVNPPEGCFLEPTAYMITDRGIERKGNSRLPGIFYSSREFLDGIAFYYLKITGVNWDRTILFYRGSLPGHKELVMSP